MPFSMGIYFEPESLLGNDQEQSMCNQKGIQGSVISETNEVSGLCREREMSLKKRQILHRTHFPVWMEAATAPLEMPSS
jgi:hypothetical protein